MSNIVNALALADVLGAAFRFGWPDPAPTSQSVLPMQETFSPGFIRRYGATAIEPARYIRWAGNPLPLPVVERTAADPECAGIHYRWWKQGATLGLPGDAPIGSEALRRAAARIEFARPIAGLLEHARTALPSGAVVIHARRSDIVYGHNRILLWNDKYAPLALVKACIRHLQASRRPIVFISDDAATMELATSFNGVLLSADLKLSDCPDEPDRDAFFDMFLMASCELVVSTQSGLSTYAALASGTKIVHVFDYFAKVAALTAIRDDLAEASGDYSPLDRNKARQYMALELAEVMTAEDRVGTLAEVSRVDSDNPTYPQLHAVALLRLGNEPEAEQVLASVANDLLARGTAASGELAEHFHGLSIDSGYEVLAEHAGPQCPFITAHVSRHLLDTRDIALAIKLAEIALRVSPAHPVLLIQAARASLAGGSHQRAMVFVRDLKRVAPSLPLVEALANSARRPAESAR